MNIGVILLDPARRLVFSNDSAHELVGVSDSRALAEQWSRLRRRIAKFLDRAEREESEVRVEIAVGPRRTSRRIELEVLRLPRSESGGFLLVLKNRGLVRALEVNLRHASKMRGLARLLTTAAHELRAPMNAISLHMELLRSSIRSGADGDERALAKSLGTVDTIQGEVQRLDRTLRDLLDLALVRKDMRRRFDVANLVRELIALLRPAAREMGIELATRVPAAATMPLLGHRDRLKQALLNILLNALEATPHGGKVRLTLTGRNENARIRVTDTGPGIPRDVLPRVWDLHFTTKEDGSGIGLHVSRAVIEELGGAIDVTSEVGEGTTFTIALPLLRREN
jgi:signal transduction histidine kinase